jgi:O-antigen/teichoic acid export membrane protein
VSTREPGAPPPFDILSTPDAGPAAVRGGVLRVGAYGVGVLLSVASAALLFRHLGVVESGEYVTVLAIVTITAGVTDVGLTAIGVREYAVRGPAERQRLLSLLLGVRIVFTAAGVAAAVGVAGLLGYREAVVLGTLLAGVGLVVQNVQTALAISLQARLRLGALSGTELLRQLLTVVFIAALVLLGAELLPFLAITIPIGLVVLAVTAFLVRDEGSVRPSFGLRELGPLLRDTLPCAAATPLGVGK